MTNGFPLYRLPQEALANVLRSMDSIDCFLFSLCSQRCKRSVSEMNLKTSRFVIAFQGFHIGLFIKFDDTSLVHVAVLPHIEMSQRLDLEAAQPYKVSYYLPVNKDNVERLEDDDDGDVEEEVTSRDDWLQKKVAQDTWWLVVQESERPYRDRWPQKQSFNLDTLSFKGWYDHFKEIYHLKQLSSFLFYDIVFHMDMEQIGRVLRRIEIGRLEAFVEPPEALQQFLSLRLSSNWLWLNPHLFRTSESLQKTLIENMGRVHVTDNGDENVMWMTLDDLLVTNVRELTLCSHTISPNDLNRFLKCWLRGSNPRSKMLEIVYWRDFDFNETVILRNIPHVKISWDDLREKLIENGYTREEKTAHNFNIRSVHGREATFTFGVTLRGSECKLFVWN